MHILSLRLFSLQSIKREFLATLKRWFRHRIHVYVDVVFTLSCSVPFKGLASTECEKLKMEIYGRKHHGQNRIYIVRLANGNWTTTECEKKLNIPLNTNGSSLWECYKKKEIIIIGYVFFILLYLECVDYFLSLIYYVWHGMEVFPSVLSLLLVLVMLWLL